MFGEIAYGGVLTRDGGSVRVVPRDGLRVRFHVIRDDQRLHMVLDHDGFAREQPIVVHDDLSRIQFTLENRTGRAHETVCRSADCPRASSRCRRRPDRDDVKVASKRSFLCR